MDTVFIRDLTLDIIIGCYEHEKVQTQQVILNIDMAWDIAQAAASDALSDTLDYNAVCKRIEVLARDSRFELVESLAEKIAATVMREFSVTGIRIDLAKPEAIANTSVVGVRIHRGVAF